MRLAILIAALLAAPAGGDECKPASHDVIAAAERRAADADAKASQAESVAVRSGNPGAQARAERARQEARDAQDEVGRLTCRAVEPRRPPPLPGLPRRGY
jgi:hypothetical protein